MVVVGSSTTYDDDRVVRVVVVVLRGVFRRVIKTDLYSVVVSAKSGKRVECFLYVNGEMMKGNILLSSCDGRHCRRGSLLWTVQTTESLRNGLTDSYCVIGVSLMSLFDENATMTVSQTMIVVLECNFT